MSDEKASRPDPMVSMGVRLPQSIKEALEEAAKEDGRTLSNYVVRVLQAHLEGAYQKGA